MSDVRDYTVVIFKRDKRCIHGVKRYDEQEFKDMSEEAMIATLEHLREELPEPKYVLELHETWVTRKNIMSGEEFQERWDTPSYMSPASEAYWSM